MSFAADPGHDETLTRATAADGQLRGSACRPQEENAFTLKLWLRKEVNLGYKTPPDHAFTVTGGTVKKAQRLEKGSNIRWQITVEPASGASVTVVLPVTTDCNAQGAICTEDGRKLSNRNEFTVSGVGG